MNGLRDLERKLVTLSGGLATVNAKAVQAAAAIIERSISRQIGNDAPRRRVAGGTVGVTRRTLRGGTDPVVLVKATGPLHLLANATEAHQITARRRSALRTPYGPRSRVQHPGTKGKNTWNQGVEESRPLALAAYDATAVAAVREAFR